MSNIAVGERVTITGTWPENAHGTVTSQYSEEEFRVTFDHPQEYGLVILNYAIYRSEFLMREGQGATTI